MDAMLWGKLNIKPLSRTIKRLSRSAPFFISNEYAAHQQLRSDLGVDHSYSYHEDGNLLYIIEIVEDEHVELFKFSWTNLIAAEKWASRGIFSYDHQMDAFRS